MDDDELALLAALEAEEKTTTGVAAAEPADSPPVPRSRPQRRTQPAASEQDPAPVTAAAAAPEPLSPHGNPAQYSYPDGDVWGHLPLQMRHNLAGKPVG